MGAWILFGVLSAVLIGGAVMVVRARDLVHIVLWLALTLIGTAVVYVALQADFLAAAQVLLYTGGVITLMLFAVMLTRRLQGAAITLERTATRTRGLLVGLSVFGIVVASVARSGASQRTLPPMTADSQALGELFLTRLMLPFEVLSLLLLAAMIGAVVLARRDGPRKALPSIDRRLPRADSAGGPQ